MTEYLNMFTHTLDVIFDEGCADPMLFRPHTSDDMRLGTYGKGIYRGLGVWLKCEVCNGTEDCVECPRCGQAFCERHRGRRLCGCENESRVAVGMPEGD